MAWRMKVALSAGCWMWGAGQPLGEVVAVALTEAKQLAGHVGLQEQERQLVIQLP